MPLPTKIPVRVLGYGPRRAAPAFGEWQRLGPRRNKLVLKIFTRSRLFERFNRNTGECVPVQLGVGYGMLECFLTDNSRQVVSQILFVNLCTTLGTIHDHDLMNR